MAAAPPHRRASARGPSRPGSPPTAPRAAPPCRRGSLAPRGARARGRSPGCPFRSLAGAPWRCRRSGRPGRAPPALGGAGGGCSTSPRAAPGRRRTRSSRTGPAPRTPPRSFSRSARSCPRSWGGAGGSSGGGRDPSGAPPQSGSCPASSQTAGPGRRAFLWARRTPPPPGGRPPARAPPSGCGRPRAPPRSGSGHRESR